MSGVRCRGGRGRPGHLFLCRSCRIDARIAAAWRRLSREPEWSALGPASEEFIRRVATAAIADRRRTLRRRAVLSAAAALLFFFLAGAGRESQAADTAGPEETYSQLLAPSALESLLPD
jgi:hypothetical protein